VETWSFVLHASLLPNVSEELSSVETTYRLPFCYRISLEFQKNLVVWKHYHPK